MVEHHLAKVGIGVRFPVSAQSEAKEDKQCTCAHCAGEIEGRRHIAHSNARCQAGLPAGRQGSRKFPSDGEEIIRDRFPVSAQMKNDPWWVIFRLSGEATLLKVVSGV